jgi:hypothetical protein
VSEQVSLASVAVLHRKWRVGADAERVAVTGIPRLRGWGREEGALSSLH